MSRTDRGNARRRLRVRRRRRRGHGRHAVRARPQPLRHRRRADPAARLLRSVDARRRRRARRQRRAGSSAAAGDRAAGGSGLRSRSRQRILPARCWPAPRIRGARSSAAGPALHADHARLLRGSGQFGLRRRAVGDGALLLPERRHDLSRHQLLSTSSEPLPRAGRFRPGLCHRPRGRPPYPGSDRHARQGRRRSSRRASAERRAMRSRSGSSCRPIATPASGRPTPRRATASRCSSRATSRRGCAPPRRSATTPCSRQTQGVVVPDSFTHGSSAQRVQWLRKGLESGNPAACDTGAGHVNDARLTVLGE